ncbi:amino acid ABC transporter permease [Desulfoplanes formicivorans]|uniref:Putative glutamine transport system permease protein GlnP n=1 Tax=Desulfoplanes formicivorans TaxID=1592317 RepID=A0A194AKC2_9BACT|nr:amino acid ABC transporter permease [Desulfoplanes formicivorans]GAU09685.1 ABC transporter permease [Desulfoplanes formicivorans]
MTAFSGLDRPRGKAYNLFWTGVFFLLLITGCWLMYTASQSVDYTWRWYRIPQYFYYTETVDVRSEIEGEVASVRTTGDDIVISVQGEGETASYTLPGGEPLLDEGDFVSMGDILGTYEQGTPGVLLTGLWMTLEVSLFAIVLGIIIGLLTGLARIADNPALRLSAITYIELIRGSPLLVQIFLWYFVVGTLINTLLAKHGISQIPSLWFGVISLALFAGAYIAEIVRAGIQSVHRGQMEAARSLGMDYVQAMRKVILPQAFRRILPPLAGQFISLIKDSSLLGVIAIRELTKATRETVSTSLQPFELWIVCAILYLVLTFALSMFVQYLERKAI